MGIIKLEEILGARCGDEIACQDCLSISERLDLEEDEIFTRDLMARANKVYAFCDRCQKRL
jgi:hypothetical protein